MASRAASPNRVRSALVASGVLQITGLTKRYGATVALDNVSLDIPSDCYVSLLGASGSGKTVLLRVIAGFEEADSGAIFRQTRPAARPCPPVDRAKGRPV